jgi:hypothetical protein
LQPLQQQLFSQAAQPQQSAQGCLPPQQQEQQQQQQKQKQKQLFSCGEHLQQGVQGSLPPQQQQQQQQQQQHMRPSSSALIRSRRMRMRSQRGWGLLHFIQVRQKLPDRFRAYCISHI